MGRSYPWDRSMTGLIARTARNLVHSRSAQAGLDHKPLGRGAGIAKRKAGDQGRGRLRGLPDRLLPAWLRSLGLHDLDGLDDVAKSLPLGAQVERIAALQIAQRTEEGV